MANILLVDNDLSAIEGVKFLLEMKGHMVFTARNGELALEILNEFKPDVILSELDLPVEDGVVLGRKILRTKGMAGTPLIGYTRLPSIYMQKYRDLYVVFKEVLTKPEDAKKIDPLITSYLK